MDAAQDTKTVSTKMFFFLQECGSTLGVRAIRRSAQYPDNYGMCFPKNDCFYQQKISIEEIGLIGGREFGVQYRNPFYMFSQCHDFGTFRMINGVGALLY